MAKLEDIKPGTYVKGLTGNSPSKVVQVDALWDQFNRYCYLLVTIDAAKAQLSAEEVARQTKEKQWVGKSPSTSVSARASSWTPDASGAQSDFTERAQAAAVQARPHSFVLGMSIDRLHANKQMQQLLEEVVGQLERVDDVEVDIRIEVTAYSEEGFDRSIERTINENCNTLGIIDAGFSEVR